MENEKGTWRCRECGSIGYLENQTVPEEQMKGKHKKQQTKVITATNKRKFYDSHGNPINDETLIQDILQGKTVISYREEKSGSDKPVVVKR